MPIGTLSVPSIAAEFKPKRHQMYILRLTLFALLLFTIFPATHAQSQSGITSPASGSTVSGDVPLLGTAVIEPFQKYELYFKQEPSGDDAYIWFAGGTQQVTNGQLGVWQAAALPPGTYSIRLRVVKNDGNYAEFFARDLSLNLNAESPTPTPTETASGPIATPIPSATFTPAPQPTVALGQVSLPQAGAAPPADTPTPEPVAAVVAEPAQDQAASVGISSDTSAEAVPAAGQIADPARDEIESNSITRQLGEALAFSRLRTQFFNGVRYSAALFLIVAVIFLGKRSFGWARSRL